MWKKFKKTVIGEKLDINDSQVLHKLSLAAFFAWVGLGSDGLSSSCYGPSEIMQTLGAHTSLSLIVAFASLVTIFIISSSYSQIIELFPNGGGGYLVATKLLSPKWGMVSGSALLIDYVLTITVSIASGADAFFSLLPPSWLYLKIPFASAVLIFLIVLNLRGVKESVKVLVPIFMVFVVTHLFVIVYAIVTHSFDLTNVVAKTQTDFSNTVGSLGIMGTFMLLIRAYSMGAGTYTGIEAVSNGIPILKEPKVHTAKKTMTYMAISLSVTVFGLLLAYLLYNVSIQPGKTINAVLFETMTLNWNPTLSSIFIVVILVSEAFILFVAAQTGFLDGPRVLSNMALDKWVPTKFSNLNDRLVTQNGVLLMGAAALILMLLSHGNVSFLVVLYSINVFITFVISQLGMVKHWWSERKTDKRWLKKILINGTGLFLCSSILAFVVIVKFFEGGWITILITLSLVYLLAKIRDNYTQTEAKLNEFNTILDLDLDNDPNINNTDMTVLDVKAKTAVLLVTGYSGIGIHSVWAIIRLFGKGIKNIVFISVGRIDASIYKNHNEIEVINGNIRTDINKYVKYVNKLGYYSEAYSSVAPNVMEELNGWVDIVRERFPDSIFFGGQLVHKNENVFTKYLHNHFVFDVQKNLYHKGIQFVILPLRLNEA